MSTTLFYEPNLLHFVCTIFKFFFFNFPQISVNSFDADCLSLYELTWAAFDSVNIDFSTIFFHPQIFFQYRLTKDKELMP